MQAQTLWNKISNNLAVSREGSFGKSTALVLSAFAFFLLFQAKIPLYPVSITLQTMGLLLVGLFWPRRQALYAMLAYLAAASLGFPVQSGWESNALWILKPAAGFLIGFPLCVWTIAFLRTFRTKVTLFNSFAILMAGQGVLYLCGLSWLALYVPLSELLSVGLVPFIPGLLCKTIAAVCCDKALSRLR